MKFASFLLSTGLAGPANSPPSSILTFEIENDRVGRRLEHIDGGENFDWLAPHAGPVYAPGTEVSLLLSRKQENRLRKKLSIVGQENFNSSPLQPQLDRIFDNLGVSRSTEFDFFKYHDFNEIESWLLDDVSSSSLAKVKSAGKTFENRDIYVVTIGSDSQPKITVDCGIHAREWVSPTMCLFLIDQLINGDYQYMREGITWVIFPVLNPDGYQYTWSDGGTNASKRFWRKNRRVNDGSSCIGVDLNRNYDVRWNQAGTSSSPCSFTYGGTAAFSEAESKAHADHVNSLEHVGAYLTFHAYGTLLLYPYSAKRSWEADNREELDNLAKEYSDKTKAVNNEFYSFGEGAEIFGEVAGGSDDWAHKSGIPISYTIELRDRGTYKFALPESMIERTVRENIEGVSAIYEHVLAKAAGQKTTSTVKTTLTTMETTTSASEEVETDIDHCPCLDSILSEVEQFRKDVAITCLNKETATDAKGRKPTYIQSQCGNKKPIAKKVVCIKKNGAWIAKKNPFKKIIKKKC
ncbi:Oidioi.mRNA.OKI2018_I69.chr2.g5101.t1.cds [Oikopleura dioica]|uniref:Oidioi.mRNA.OKI2018_I69.chr2.g5101.t1.cds n=1 Tax=Oikopleura dioica TaxID=34765 RepID=A0ABN7SZH4_OIKDI|nr:Oidioi.mRNA.OKI2018_I69.chr2.g5101.t1.cds [Oikopleura dioica]